MISLFNCDIFGLGLIVDLFTKRPDQPAEPITTLDEMLKAALDKANKNYTYELAYYDAVTEEYVQSIPLNMSMDEARKLFNISQSEYPGDCLLVESADQLRKVLEGYSNYDLPVEYKAGCYFVEILKKEGN